MSAKDIYHAPFVRALEKDGWTITKDPLTIPIGRTEFLIDLGAERVIAAERDGERIAVEIKSFVKPSLVQDLKEATGQFVLYAGALADDPNNADRTLFLAIRDETYETVFEQPIGLLALRTGHLRLIVIDPAKEEIIEWIR